jgi:glutamine amidotransferase
MVVAIIDYGLGNLYSILQACAYVDLPATITSDLKGIENSDAIILPGVGAFSQAMQALSDLSLIDALIRFCASEKPLLGICLGMQLLFTESEEFGRTSGLNIIAGKVIKLQNPNTDFEIFKIPHIGWSQIHPPQNGFSWEKTILQGIIPGKSMYFVHSYFCRPDDQSFLLSSTNYNDLIFCSAVNTKNIYAVQFHPERSGLLGLKIFENFKKLIYQG